MNLDFDLNNKFKFLGTKKLGIFKKPIFPNSFISIVKALSKIKEIFLNPATFKFFIFNKIFLK